MRHPLRRPQRPTPRPLPRLPRSQAEATPARPLDQRSALRQAYEAQDWAGVLAAIKADTTTTIAGCHQWRRQTRDGYAVVRLGNRRALVHRLVVEAKHGAPLGDQPVHHECANTQCVNPAHLTPVSHRENIAEMLARRYLEGRIRQLETALAESNPAHPLLAEVGIA